MLEGRLAIVRLYTDERAKGEHDPAFRLWQARERVVEDVARGAFRNVLPDAAQRDPERCA